MFTPLAPLAQREPSGFSSSLKEVIGSHTSAQLLIDPPAPSLAKNRPLSVTMKFLLTLATALFLPFFVNAQNKNGSVTVSGVHSSVPIIRSIDAP